MVSKEARRRHQVVDAMLAEQMPTLPASERFVLAALLAIGPVPVGGRARVERPLQNLRRRGFVRQAEVVRGGRRFRGWVVADEALAAEAAEELQYA